MNRLERIIIIGALAFAVSLSVQNNTKIDKISGVYFDQSVIDNIEALNYKPTELVDANVLVGTKNGRGSGSIIKVTDKGTYILTAAHVVYGQKIVRDANDKLRSEGKIARVIAIYFKGKEYKVRVVKIDRELDLAVLKTYKKLKVTPVKIAKAEPELGEIVWTVSNPGGQPNVVNNGVFSAVEEDKNEKPVAYVSTAGYFGSSGGMIVNTKGEQIGVISTVAVARVGGYFPSITVYNGTARTHDLIKFLRGVI
jgi:S1-C subfamily serine protease